MAFLTAHIQKDGRVSTGSVVHKYKDCKQLKNRTGIIEDSGPIAQMLPKCYTCFNRMNKTK